MFRPPQYVALLPLGPTSTLRHIDNWWGNIWISTNRDPVNTSDMEENTEKTKKKMTCMTFLCMTALRYVNMTSHSRGKAVEGDRVVFQSFVTWPRLRTGFLFRIIASNAFWMPQSHGQIWILRVIHSVNKKFLTIVLYDRQGSLRACSMRESMRDDSDLVAIDNDLPMKQEK